MNARSRTTLLQSSHDEGRATEICSLCELMAAMLLCG
jgi:hypothetical protein